MVLKRRSFSKTIVQQPRDARTRRIMTLLTIGSACRNRPKKDMSCDAAGMISFMMAISLHEGNGVDLGGRLNYRQAILPRAGCAFARQDIVEENTSEPQAIQPWKIEKLDQGL